MGGLASFGSGMDLSLLLRCIDLGLRRSSDWALGFGDFFRKIRQGGLAPHPLDH